MAATKRKTAANPGANPGANPRRKRRTPSRRAPRRPIRREAWGGILLALAACALVSLFRYEGLLVRWMAHWLQGLLGYGAYAAAPALALGGWILIFHKRRTVRIPLTCALLLPVCAGALGHLLLRNADLPGPGLTAYADQLWHTGQRLSSGGLLSGTLAAGAEALFSKPLAAVVLIAISGVLLMAALRLSPGAILERYRALTPYDDAEEETAALPVQRRPKKRQGARSTEKQSGGQRDMGQIGLFAEAEEEAALPPPEERKALASAQKKALPAAKPAERFAALLPRRKEEAAPSDQAAKATGSAESGAESAAGTDGGNTSGKAQQGGNSAGKTRKKAASPQKAERRASGDSAAGADENAYTFPPLDLLIENHAASHTEAKAELEKNARRLAETLTSFGVPVAKDEIHVTRGPSVTCYEFELNKNPGAGGKKSTVKLSKITNLADDIALALGSEGVRIAPIPAKSSVVGIEVPNRQVTPVLIRDVVGSAEFAAHKSSTAFAVGKDINGRSIIGSVERLPHVLIAGTTGSGKSVCMNSLIISLIYKSSPAQVRFIMIDPKMVELAPYNAIPHLLVPVVTDPRKAADALQWAVGEMMRRYKLFSENSVKKLEEYNRLMEKTRTAEPLPSVIVVIDELADLMIAAAKEVEEAIMRVAQMGRAAGIHLVIATQRPSADVITGLMKANIPSRIAFAVASAMESRIILDTAGAEKLAGRGDMLYAPLGESRRRVQGCFVSPEEIEKVVSFLKQTGRADYDSDAMHDIDAYEEKRKKRDKADEGAEAQRQLAIPLEENDELLPAAVDVVLETGQASVSMLQRRLKLGYSRAARLVDQMEERGYVGPFEGSRARQILITPEQWKELRVGVAVET